LYGIRRTEEDSQSPLFWSSPVTSIQLSTSYDSPDTNMEMLHVNRVCLWACVCAESYVRRIRMLFGGTIPV
jgi:hypothetical protein